MTEYILQIFIPIAFTLGVAVGAFALIGFKFIHASTKEDKEEITDQMTYDKANLLISQDSYARHGIVGFKQVSDEEIAKAKEVILSHILKDLEQ